MRKCVLIVAAIGLSLSWLCAYGEEEKPPAEPEEAAVAPEKLPVVAKVVEWENLIGFIPKAPKGWKAAKPIGNTDRPGGPFALSRVSQTYAKGKQRVTFILEDLGTSNPYFSMEEPWKPTERKMGGWQTKKAMLGKVAAEESFNRKEKRGTVFLVFEKRVQLNVSGTGIEDTSILVQLGKSINFEELKKTLEEKSK